MCRGRWDGVRHDLTDLTFNHDALALTTNTKLISGILTSDLNAKRVFSSKMDQPEVDVIFFITS